MDNRGQARLQHVREVAKLLEAKKKNIRLVYWQLGEVSAGVPAWLADRKMHIEQRPLN